MQMLELPCASDIIDHADLAARQERDRAVAAQQPRRHHRLGAVHRLRVLRQRQQRRQRPAVGLRSIALQSTVADMRSCRSHESGTQLDCDELHVVSKFAVHNGPFLTTW